MPRSKHQALVTQARDFGGDHVRKRLAHRAERAVAGGELGDVPSDGGQERAVNHLGRIQQAAGHGINDGESSSHFHEFDHTAQVAHLGGDVPLHVDGLHEVIDPGAQWAARGQIDKALAPQAG